MTNAKWIVGPEYDAFLLEKVGLALRALDYTIDSNTWGAGGSQELSTWSVCGPHGPLVVEAETYIGLSVSGDSKLVSDLQIAFTALPDGNRRE